MRHSKTRTPRTCWLTILLAMAFLSPAESGDQDRISVRGEEHPALIKIVDEYGRQAQSGEQPAGGQIFDVAVGPVDNAARFVPDTLNISVGDTVRWTWGTDTHTVTSGTPCTVDGLFCSPDNMNCDAEIPSNAGTVYAYTFTQAGTYSYFCGVHCFAGMTGVINVAPNQRPTPTPRPRPSPHPRPVTS